MPKRDIAQATADSQDTAIQDVAVPTKRLESAGPQKKTKVFNTDFPKWYGYFMTIPELNSALIMKSIWTVGKGYETKDSHTKNILNAITGNGKQTFLDLLFNADIVKNMNGRSYCEIIRTKDDSEVQNLKNLDPALVTEIYNPKGRIIGYDYLQASGVTKRFAPDKIFHLINCGLGLGGVSRIAPLEATCKALNETFTDLKYLMHHQARPIIIFKLKTDDQTKINAFIVKMDTAMNKGRNVYVPDDENLLDWKVLEVDPSQMVIQWLDNVLTNRFYRGVGMPLVLFGQAGQNESGGKIEFTGHGQVWEHDQLYIEQQVKAQLGYEIDLIHPESLLQDLKTDEAKDKNQGLELQKNDITAGAGRDNAKEEEIRR